MRTIEHHGYGSGGPMACRVRGEASVGSARVVPAVIGPLAAWHWRAAAEFWLSVGVFSSRFPGSRRLTLEAVILLVGC